LALGIGSAVPLASWHNGGISSRRWERGRHRVSCAIASQPLMVDCHVFLQYLPHHPFLYFLSPPPQQQLVGWLTRERDWMEPRPGRGSGIVCVVIVDGLRSSECHCDGGHCFASVLCRSSEEKWGGEVSISLVVDDSNSLMSNLTTWPIG
jgi:hypothetical protein